MGPGGITGLIDTVATRHLFFTGKGGVGKTSAACATAVGLADRGASVLLVSTDPASNLDEVLGFCVGTAPTPVPGVGGLAAMDIDPEQAAAAYRERVIGPYRDSLPASAVAAVEEQLSGACTVEIAAFDEFTGILAGGDEYAHYDHVVFDTAPTGHTLRLLALPAAWTDFIGDGTGTSCIGPLSGLQAQQDRYRQAVAVLADGAATTLVLVARTDPASLREADRAGTELAALGVGRQRLVLNGVFRATDGTDPLAVAMDVAADGALAAMPRSLAALPRTTVPLLAGSLTGVDGLRALVTSASVVGDAATRDDLRPPDGVGGFDALLDEIAAPARGLVMTMGKGGVGKTTVAAAVAVELARRGHQVELTTTDPAAHVAEAVGADVIGLRVTRIDPAAETVAYTASVLAEAGADVDQGARAVLEEDLRSPCTEEIAVFRAFARTVAAAGDRFVVIDTAPTGHTLLLLDAARSYHREVTRQTGAMPDEVLHLLDRLRDGLHTHVLLVALAEATPVHEAARLQADLRRSGMTPRAWVLDQSLLAAGPSDPLLVARAREELRYVDEVRAGLADHVVVLPKVPRAPVGAARLRALVAGAAAAARV